jgi:hypothetical protein
VEHIAVRAKGHHACQSPYPLIFLLLFALSVFVEIEHRAGMRLSVDTDSLRHEQLAAARDAIGLLLSLAIARFRQRKQLLVDEANSISRTALRARYASRTGQHKSFRIAWRIC